MQSFFRVHSIWSKMLLDENCTSSFYVQFPFLLTTPASWVLFVSPLKLVSLISFWLKGVEWVALLQLLSLQYHLMHIMVQPALGTEWYFTDRHAPWLSLATTDLCFMFHPDFLFIPVYGTELQLSPGTAIGAIAASREWVVPRHNCLCGNDYAHPPLLLLLPSSLLCCCFCCCHSCCLIPIWHHRCHRCHGCRRRHRRRRCHCHLCSPSHCRPCQLCHLLCCYHLSSSSLPP